MIRSLFVPLFFTVFVCLSYPVKLSAVQSTSKEDDELINLSFYRGYLLWKEQLAGPELPYDLDQVVAGMRAAQKGEYPKEVDASELQRLVRKCQEHLLAREKEENLANAERFLSSIRAEKDVAEIIKDRLYHKRLQPGSGASVKANSSPVLTFVAKVLELDGEEEFIAKPEPGPFSLCNTIPGFSKGVVGMLVGEHRRLFIHPELAYGVDGGLVGPNRLMLFDIQVVSVD